MISGISFVAVKCNDDPAVIAVLAQLGTGFDCASKVMFSRTISVRFENNLCFYFQFFNFHLDDFSLRFRKS